MNYGKAVKIIRNSRELSQKELASRIGLAPSYISRIEAGDRKPTTETLELISKELKVPLYLLILMSSEKEDIKNLPEEMISNLGQSLLGIVLETESC